jgi:hypothetical protein
MLRTFFRILAFVLLALTLPLQGMAGVMAGQCNSLAHHESDAPVADRGHGHGDAGGEHASHSHAADPDASQPDESASHCGPCTACCASASIAGAGPASLVSSPTTAHHLFAQSPPPGVEPDALYRPPLSL